MFWPHGNGGVRGDKERAERRWEGGIGVEALARVEARVLLGPCGGGAERVVGMR
jgi:hypothetical protein